MITASQAIQIINDGISAKMIASITATTIIPMPLISPLSAMIFTSYWICLIVISIFSFIEWKTLNLRVWIVICWRVRDVIKSAVLTYSRINLTAVHKRAAVCILGYFAPVARIDATGATNWTDSHEIRRAQISMRRNSFFAFFMCPHVGLKSA